MVAAEIFILFEVIAFVFFFRAVEERGLLYSIIGFAMFSILTLESFAIDTLFTGQLYTSWEGIGFNSIMSTICLILTFVFYFVKPAEQITGEKGKGKAPLM